MFPFAAAAIRLLNEAALPVIVVTNQSGVGRGYFPEELVHTVHELMAQQLAAAGARLDAIYYCPHTSADVCESRKPKPGMLERAARDSLVRLRQSEVDLLLLHWPNPQIPLEETLGALWALVWAGEVTNDTLEPLRSLASGATVPSGRDRRALERARGGAAAVARPPGVVGIWVTGASG